MSHGQFVFWGLSALSSFLAVWYELDDGAVEDDPPPAYHKGSAYKPAKHERRSFFVFMWGVMATFLVVFGFSVMVLFTLVVGYHFAHYAYELLGNVYFWGK